MFSTVCGLFLNADARACVWVRAYDAWAFAREQADPFNHNVFLLPSLKFYIVSFIKMPKAKNSDGGEPKPASNFVHLSYKSLTDYEDL